MIRLTLPKEPYWLTIVPAAGDKPAARVKVRPLNTAVYEAAKTKAAREAGTMRDSYEDVIEAGGTVDNFPDLEDADMRDGLANMMVVAALAQYAIIEWTGFGLDDDTEAPVTPETTRAFAAIPSLARTFMHEYLRPLAAVAAEGNASGSAPNGTTAAGPITARAAAKKTTVKRAGRAPTKRKRRKASKGRKPGAS